MGIQCKGLANLSDLPHCPTLKASASIVSAGGRRGKASLQTEESQTETRVRTTESSSKAEVVAGS